MSTTNTPFRPLPAEPAYVSWRGHQVATYSAGSGRPLLLIHSINAAASAYEMHGPFTGLQDTYRVHALDLLGYGCSDRPARRYYGEDYVDLIGAQLARIGEPTVLIASSLGAAYAIGAAARRPELVSALVLACPVGLGQLDWPAGRIAHAFHRLLRGPVGRLLFQLLTTRSSIAYFLKQQAYHNPAQITPEVVEAYYQACRHPNARYAPICFLTGLLNYNVAADLPRLTQPILLVWGDQARTTPVSRAAAFQAANPRARLAVLQGCSQLVQEEQPERFNAEVRAFLG